MLMLTYISFQNCSAKVYQAAAMEEDNALLLKQADQEKIDLAVSQQIALVGSKSLYEKINKNFKEHGFDAIFAKVKLINSIFVCYVIWNIDLHLTCPGAL